MSELPKENELVKAYLYGGGYVQAYFINGNFYPSQIPAQFTEKLNVMRWEKI
jgi:hypothetical protein